MPASDVIDVDWDFILQTIQAEKCILFIGPEVFTDEQNVTIEKALVEHLGVGENPDIQSYYDQENLFLFTSRAKKTKTFYKIKSFYDQPFPTGESLFSKIAEIPFHIIIKMTPDKRINEVFTQKKVPFDFHFYWKKVAPDHKLKTPSGKHPLIYNMLGSIDRQESMILTHNDLFDYFESIFAGSSMPEKLKRLLKEANNFIFIGVPFTKWYMQLLLRILYIHSDFDFVRYASNQAINEETRTFCFDQFRIEFVPSNIHSFIDELHQRCQAEGVIREIDEHAMSTIDHLKKLLSNDHLDELFHGLKDYLSSLQNHGEDLVDDVLLLKSKFNRLNKRVIQGIIDDQEATVKMNKIRKEILQVINEAETL